LINQGLFLSVKRRLVSRPGFYNKPAGTDFSGWKGIGFINRPVNPLPTWIKRLIWDVFWLRGELARLPIFRRTFDTLEGSQ